MKKNKFSRWSFLLCIAGLAGMVLFAGCTSNGGTDGAGEKETLKIAGSTTVQPIASKAAEAYMKKNPNILVSVQAGGSGAGIKMVSEGSVDIGMSSREIKSEELEATPGLQTHAIALDGIVIVTHPGNTLTDLTKEQVRAIFSGETTNYKEIGGPDMEIVVINREEGSGTRGTFEELVMEKTPITEKALQKPSNGAMKAAVSENENAMGYIGLGYVDETVKAMQIEGVTPSVASVKDGSYPVSRKLYMVTNGEASGTAKDFIDYVTGSEGQDIVAEEGFIKL